VERGKLPLSILKKKKEEAKQVWPEVKFPTPLKPPEEKPSPPPPPLSPPPEVATPPTTPPSMLTAEDVVAVIKDLGVADQVKKRYDELSAEVAQLQKEIDELKKQLAEREERLKELLDKKNRFEAVMRHL